jgi:hypothetical protein
VQRQPSERCLWSSGRRFLTSLVSGKIHLLFSWERGTTISIDRPLASSGAN